MLLLRQAQACCASPSAAAEAAAADASSGRTAASHGAEAHSAAARAAPLGAGSLAPRGVERPTAGATAAAPPATAASPCDKSE
eukprot:3808438-Prymnesium_polylepis.1